MDLCGFLLDGRNLAKFISPRPGETHAAFPQRRVFNKPETVHVIAMTLKTH
jgi:hypothetical protein